MATVAGASPVAQAATVEVPVGTIAVGRPSVAQVLSLDGPEETLVPTGISERITKLNSAALEYAYQPIKERGCCRLSGVAKAEIWLLRSVIKHNAAAHLPCERGPSHRARSLRRASRSAE